jgi:hypothetical protein
MLIKTVIALLRFFEVEPNVSPLGLIPIRLVVSLFLMGIAWLLVLGGLGFIIWAFYLYMAKAFLSSTVASLVTGLVVLFLSAVLILSARLLGVRRSRGRSTTGLLSFWLRRYPTESALAALATGFLVAASPDVRKAFVEGIMLLLKQNAPGSQSTEQTKETPTESSRK